jgi:hypothetical protein
MIDHAGQLSVVVPRRMFYGRASSARTYGIVDMAGLLSSRALTSEEPRATKGRHGYVSEWGVGGRDGQKQG